MAENQIILGDCLEIMRGMADKSVDLVLTDPPYGVGINYDNTLTDEKLSTEWFKEASRVGKAIIFTSGVVNMFEYPKPDWVLCWYKPGAVSRTRYGFNSWEPILVYNAPPSPREPDVVRVSVGMQHDTGNHPTPKPKELFRYLVNRFSKEGDFILDPFAGSGTTLVAAKQLKRRFMGIEISPNYVTICEDRLSALSEALF